MELSFDSIWAILNENAKQLAALAASMDRQQAEAAKQRAEDERLAKIQKRA